MKLYLIRHSESANNAIFSSSGTEAGRCADPEITERGHRQAERLAAHLADAQTEPHHHPFDEAGKRSPGFALTHLYCSLMTRSILTARYIAERSRLKLVAWPDIFEYRGLYESDVNGEHVAVSGPGRRHFAEHFPELELPSAVSDTGWYDRGVETEDEFIQRVRTVAGRLLEQHGDEEARVAMVVHGDFIDQFINEITGVARRSANYSHHWAANWAFHNTSVTRIDFHDAARVVVYTNRIDHLSPELVSW